MDKRTPTGPHQFRNEDGRVFGHNGYVGKVCQKCGVEFVVGNDTAQKYAICLSCEHNIKEPV